MKKPVFLLDPGGVLGSVEGLLAALVDLSAHVRFEALVGVRRKG